MSARIANRLPCRPSPSINMPKPSKIAQDDARAAPKVAGRRASSDLRFRFNGYFQGNPVGPQKTVTIHFRDPQGEPVRV